jgi:hypothetical protein
MPVAMLQHGQQMETQTTVPQHPPAAQQVYHRRGPHTAAHASAAASCCGSQQHPDAAGLSRGALSATLPNCRYSQGYPAGIRSSCPCSSPTRNSKQSTNRGPGRLNIAFPSTSTTRPSCTARSCFHQGRCTRSGSSLYVSARSKPQGQMMIQSGSDAMRASLVTALEGGAPAPGLLRPETHTHTAQQQTPAQYCHCGAVCVVLWATVHWCMHTAPAAAAVHTATWAPWPALPDNNEWYHSVSTTTDKRYHAHSMMCPCCGQCLMLPLLPSPPTVAH